MGSPFVFGPPKAESWFGGSNILRPPGGPIMRRWMRKSYEDSVKSQMVAQKPDLSRSSLFTKTTSFNYFICFNRSFSKINHHLLILLTIFTLDLQLKKHFLSPCLSHNLLGVTCVTSKGLL